jgi:hypothetical protein
MCIAACEDYLVGKLLKQGGFGTLQLNAIGHSPKLKFVRPDEACIVEQAVIAGRLVSAAELSVKPGMPAGVRSPRTLEPVPAGVRNRIAHMPKPLLDALRKKLAVEAA